MNSPGLLVGLHGAIPVILDGLDLDFSPTHLEDCSNVCAGSGWRLCRPDEADVWLNSETSQLWEIEGATKGGSTTGQVGDGTVMSAVKTPRAGTGVDVPCAVNQSSWVRGGDVWSIDVAS